MNRTRITQDRLSGEVTVRYFDHFENDWVETTYFCPFGGGYVRVRDAAGHYPQVCEGLARTGNTLMVSCRQMLLPLIRSEYRRMRREEKSRWGF